MEGCNSTLQFGQPRDALVDRQLANGGGNVVRIADQLNLSRSTLHRRLAQQGLSFEGIVDSVRRRRAEEYLGLPSVPLHQLAALLGYTNGVSLHRSGGLRGLQDFLTGNKLQTPDGRFPPLSVRLQ